MSNNIELKKGLNIPLEGTAALKTKEVGTTDIVAVKPTDFRGLVPRLLVKEGDKVLAGSPILADKESPEILFTSPVSGTIDAVIRGAKRKLLEIRIKADAEQEYVDFGIQDVDTLKDEDVKNLLLKSGLWAGLIQRPYGIIANPEIKPKAIFVSAFNTAPLAADTDYALDGEFANIQAGVNALSKLTDGGVHVSFNDAQYNSTPLHKLENVIAHTFSGKHPAGNVGIQIHHISPIQKGETVWTITPLLLAAIGKLLRTGKLDLTRKIAVTGPEANDPCYITGIAGMSMNSIESFCKKDIKDIRFISGNALTGTNVGYDGFLGFFDNQITLLEEGNKFEMFGWANPIRSKQFSASRTYFSWLTPKKKYNLDTNTHGGVRAFVMSDVYGKVLPMNIFPVYLVKACLANDIDKMEKFGIYEVLEEDLALCEYVCPSKIEIQSIISDGINLMLKEMA